MEKKYICNVSTAEVPLGLPVMFEPVVNRVSSASIARKLLEGQEHFIVPMVMLTEGILHGSLGPVYYPPDIIKNSTHLWDGKPIVVYHPELFVSSVAGNPTIFNNQKIGTVFNTTFDGKQLRAEAWIDIKRAGVVDPRVLKAIQNRQMMEVSTGVFVQTLAENGRFNDNDYEFIAGHLTPDHLAVLPDKEGACSIADGCGLVRNDSEEPLLLPKMFDDQSEIPAMEHEIVMDPAILKQLTTPTEIYDEDPLVLPTMKFD